MFFTLTNYLVTFQIIINEILWDLINTGEVVNFIGDIIVETKEEEGYNEVVKKVVKQLAENNLYVKLEKYKQKIRKVGFLRIVIRSKGIQIEEEKMKGILEWPTPKGIKYIQKFLELSNYYQWFIKNFAVIARLLHNLVRKNQKWDYTERQEVAFRKLKKRFTKELVLAVLDLN